MNSRMKKGMLLMLAGAIACTLFMLIGKSMTPDNETEATETTEQSQTATMVTVSPDKKPILNFGKGNAGKSTMVVMSSNNDEESQAIAESETEESKTEATEALKNTHKSLASMIGTVGMLVSCLLVITGVFNIAMGILHPLEP